MLKNYQSSADTTTPPQSNHAPKKHHWTNDPATFLVNLVGVIAVVVYTSVAAWQASLTSAQLTVMQGQLNEMKSGSLQTSQLIGANVNLATAARRSADIAEVEARAWLAPISFAFANLNDVKEPLKVSVAYQNVGREPALKMQLLPPSLGMSLSYTIVQ
jgi:hypothetical protein